MTANFRGNVSYVYDKESNRSLLRVRLKNGKTQDIQYSKDRDRRKLEDFGEVKIGKDGTYYRSLSPSELNKLQSRSASQGGMSNVPMVKLEGKELAKYKALEQFKAAKQKQEAAKAEKHVTAVVDLRTKSAKDDKTAVPVKTVKAAAVKKEEDSQKTETKTDVPETQDQYPKKLGDGFIEVAPGQKEIDYDDPDVQKDLAELKQNALPPFPENITIPEENEENNLSGYLYEKAQPILDKVIEKSSKLVKDFDSKLEDFKGKIESQLTLENAKKIAGEAVNTLEEGFKANAEAEQAAAIAEQAKIEEKSPIEKWQDRIQKQNEQILQQVLPNVGNDHVYELTKEYANKSIENAETTARKLFSNMQITESGFTLKSKDGTPNSILIDKDFQEKAQKCIEKLFQYHKIMPQDTRILGILVGIAAGNISIDVVNNIKLDNGSIKLLSEQFYKNKDKVDKPLTQEQRMYLLKSADKKLGIAKSMDYNRWMLDTQDKNKIKRIKATVDALFDPTKTE